MLFLAPPPAWRGAQLLRHWLKYVRTEVAVQLSQGLEPAAVVATTSTLAAFDALPKQTTKISLVQAYENFGFSCPWVPLRSRIRLAKLAAVRQFQDPRLMLKSDAVLTNSEFMKRASVARFGLKPGCIHVLPQLCDINPLDFTDSANTVGFVNRGPDKGLNFVLKLAQLSPSWRYKIYGHETGIPSELPKNVEWLGWASDRNQMFASAHLWLVPSLWAEPFGRVSIEAQAADRAVLVADSGGLPETVRDSRFRILGFNAEEWLLRMQELMMCNTEDLNRNGERIRLGFSARRHDSRIAKVISTAIIRKTEESHA